MNARLGLQLEGATLTNVVREGDVLRLCLQHADIHYDDYLESHEASIVLDEGRVECRPGGLPSAISEAMIGFPGTVSYFVFVWLPFSQAGACRVELALGSGERLVAHGSACRIEVGPGVRHAYILEPGDR